MRTKRSSSSITAMLNSAAWFPETVANGEAPHSFEPLQSKESGVDEEISRKLVGSIHSVTSMSVILGRFAIGIFCGSVGKGLISNEFFAGKYLCCCCCCRLL